MVKSLVEMHGGSAIVRSEGLGKGSEFIIWLPVVTPEQAVTGRHAIENYRTASCTIGKGIAHPGGG